VSVVLSVSVGWHPALPLLARLAPDAQAVTNTSEETCDVLVVGGTPAGIAAALAAARRGSSVVLVDEHAHLGGDIVYAMLNVFDVPLSAQQASPVVHGIFAEFFDQLGIAFDIDKARRLFEDTIAAEPHIRTYKRTRVARVEVKNDSIIGVVLESTSGKRFERLITPRTIVDATNDADVAARAGAGYYLGRENANRDKKMQAAGLLFSVKNVDWGKVRAYVTSRTLINITRRVDGSKHRLDVRPLNDTAAKKATLQTPAKAWLRMGGMKGGYAWERGNIARGYTPRGPNTEFLSINFGRQSDGSVVLNTLNIVNVNGLDRVSTRRAYDEATRELPRFLNYLRRNMPGFRHARLAQVAPELYIRETRHIHGYYSLKVPDIEAHRRFADRVGLVSYPIDLHPYKKGDINPFGPRRFYYTLPLGCLIPRAVNNIFVASRSLSATYTAAGSARVLPVTIAAGEAAGTAAWLCATHDITPQDMMEDTDYVEELQQALRESGVDIGDTSAAVSTPPPAATKPAAPVREAKRNN
jgi:hypothetical protein